MNKERKEISRRTFLKGAAGLGGLALSACTSEQISQTIDQLSKIATAQATENPTATGTAAVTQEATAIVTATPEAITEAGWQAKNADNEPVEFNQLPEGFIPDENLRVVEGASALPEDVSQYRDFQLSLNTPKGELPKLAGFDPSLEEGDYCNNPDHRCSAQLNMFGWKVFTGEKVDVPGIGRLEGSENRAVALLILNRDGSVHAWDKENPVQVEHGYTGGGPIWDGENFIPETEMGLTAHYADRLLHGIPGMYQGACNNPDNCAEVLAVAVQRRQWGNYEDGNPRYVFELMRAEIVGK